MLSSVAEPVDNTARTEVLKRTLLQLGASFDRGYGATPAARKRVDEIIEELEGLDQDNNMLYAESGDSPLDGRWRMVWTTAQDVLVLAASPIFTVGAIYQDFSLPIVKNVIDLVPRAQALLPPSTAPFTRIRAEVTTRASPRKDKPRRIGLDFETVKIQPMEILGNTVDTLLPALRLQLPRVNLTSLGLFSAENTPGYFDVAFLDDEMLAIRQNSPGGFFVLVRTFDEDR
eukprot:CAMPEP_0116831052 /NCGR_PEP_ID=MMETSP0418-20121206/5117_1 /TAXON_ID=1158023 /ORGANISM="Astrosyne radiata, Strain 13vi08-1A" /LENGTH=229 /DNA_ID=CAMNT_0004460249 /DNA_START=166 /DNA_END=855 /DNA_ORIENTATION=-